MLQRRKLYRFRFTPEFIFRKKKILKRKNYEEIFHYLKKIYLHNFSPKFFKKYKELRLHLVYNVYQNNIYWIKKKRFGLKYHKLLEIWKKKKYHRRKSDFYCEAEIRYNIKLKKKTTAFFKIYHIIFYRLFSDIFFFLKVKNILNHVNAYNLILTFYRNQFFINFLNKTKTKHYFFLSMGLFAKFFGKKKSLKKNKILKVLMAKYTRKFLLILKIKKITTIVKKNPSFLLEFLKFLNTPIIHKFFNPYKKEIIEDNLSPENQIKTTYFFFLKNISFSNNKTAQKGRVKRKISRKLILKNKLID